MLRSDGLCECGCGEQPNIAKQSRTARGWVNGKPKRFVKGHENRNKGGELHASWKGGRIMGNGYVHVYVTSTHRFISMAHCKNGSYYIPEHRLVMAEYINRTLWKEEVVHHYNEVKTDNRIENLGLFHNKAAHTRFHGGNWNKRRANV